MNPPDEFTWCRTLANLALGDAPIAQGTFPSQLAALALPNCQLADYPLDLPLLVQLEDLYVSFYSFRPMTQSEI